MSLPRAEPKPSVSALSRTLLADTMPAVAAARGAPDDAGPPASAFGEGDRVDRFLVLGTLGEGAMGVVLSAYDPRLDRKVALKLLRRELLGDAGGTRGQERLLREAQAMARLSHPNVVTVYEAGVFAGRVFLAMELVEGETLRAWLAREARRWGDVVAAFGAAGRGLAAAHAVGLVHRDFKPDNVLVRRDGRACVSDFGLASAARESAGEVASDVRAGDGAATAAPSSALGRGGPLALARTAVAPSERGDAPIDSARLDVRLTEPGTLLGTPAYMAPEQGRDADVDARADQFAFAAALHEALYGTLPFEGASFAELHVAAAKGAMRPRPAGTQVPAYVHAALVRALDPAPARRFPDLDALLAALVTDPAAPRRRLVRRGALALAVVALAAGTGALGAGRAREDRCATSPNELAFEWDDNVKAAARRAFVASGRPYAADTYARVAPKLDAYAAALVAMRVESCGATFERRTQSERLFDLRAACLARMKTRLGALAAVFARGPDADVVDRAVQAASALPPVATCADVDALDAAVPPPTDPAEKAEVAALRAEIDRVHALDDAGKYKDGAAAARAVAERAARSPYRPVKAEALYWRGRLENDAGDTRAAEATLDEAVVAAAEAKDDALTARAFTDSLYVIGYKRGRHAEALALRRAAELEVARAGTDALRAELAGVLASIAHVAGRYEDARREAERAAALAEKAYGPEHPEVARQENRLGLALLALGRTAEAAGSFEHARALFEKAFGPAHPQVATVTNNLGEVSRAAGRLAEARERYERALALWEAALGPDAATVGTAHTNLGEVLLAEGRPGAARERFARGLAVWERALGPDNPRLGYALTGLGRALSAEQRPIEAIGFLERALALREATSSEPAELATTRLALAEALADAGRDAPRARELATRARDALAAAGPRFTADAARASAWLEPAPRR